MRFQLFCALLFSMMMTSTRSNIFTILCQWRWWHMMMTFMTTRVITFITLHRRGRRYWGITLLATYRFLSRMEQMINVKHLMMMMTFTMMTRTATLLHRMWRWSDVSFIMSTTGIIIIIITVLIAHYASTTTGVTHFYISKMQLLNIQPITTLISRRWWLQIKMYTDLNGFLTKTKTSKLEKSTN